MKIWVCRSSQGVYTLVDGRCEEVEAGVFRSHCSCENVNHEINDIFCASEFKKYAGLKHHLRRGTKKLMTWRLPLAGNK